MALSFTTEFEASIGDQTVKFINVTFDGTAGTLSAPLVGFYKINAVIADPILLTTEPANLSAYAGHSFVSVTGSQEDGDTLQWDVAPDKTGAKQRLMIFGW